MWKKTDAYNCLSVHKVVCGSNGKKMKVYSGTMNLNDWQFDEIGVFIWNLVKHPKYCCWWVFFTQKIRNFFPWIIESIMRFDLKPSPKRFRCSVRSGYIFLIRVNVTVCIVKMSKFRWYSVFDHCLMQTINRLPNLRFTVAISNCRDIDIFSRDYNKIIEGRWHRRKTEKQKNQIESGGIEHTRTAVEHSAIFDSHC